MDIVWDLPPFATVGKPMELGFTLSVDSRTAPALGNATTDGVFFKHVNVHACKDVTGFCTPFITGRCAVTGTFASSPEETGYAGTYTQKISIPTEGMWSAIVHVELGSFSVAKGSILQAISAVQCPKGYEFTTQGVARPPTGEPTPRCMPCAAGTHFDDVEGACVLCGPGFYSPFASEEGRPATCIPCNTLGGTFYSGDEGAETCQKCPANTVRYAGTPGTHMSECVCLEGFWEPGGALNGTECVPCEMGGECAGGTLFGRNLPPRNSDDYWGVEAAPGAFIECSMTGICLEGYKCAEDRTGRLCQACHDGWTQVGRSCWKCQESFTTNVVVTVFVMGAVVLLWFVVETVVGSIFESLEVILLYAQITEILGSFSLNWEPTVDMVVGYTSFVNFDTDFVAPSCARVPWNYTYAFSSQMVLCFIFGSVRVALYLLGCAHVWFRNHFPRGVTFPGLACTLEELEDVKDAGIKFVLAMMVLMYNVLCIKSFESFVCLDLPDGSGRQMLAAAPDIICWEGAHWVHVVMSAIGLVAYVIGVPATVAYVLWKGKVGQTFTDPHYLARYGFLYTRYEIEWFWWELVFLARRVMLCGVSVFMFHDGMAQAVVGLLVLILCFALQFYARPFRKTRLDYIDSFALVCNVMQVLGGILFTASEFKHNKVIEVLVLITLGSTLIAGMWAFVEELVNHRSRLSAKKNLRGMLPTAMVEHPDLVSDVYRVIFTDVEKAFRVLDANGDGVLEHGELKEALSSLPSGAIDDAIVSYLIKLCDDDDNGVLDVHEFRRLLFTEIVRLNNSQGVFNTSFKRLKHDAHGDDKKKNSGVSLGSRRGSAINLRGKSIDISRGPIKSVDLVNGAAMLRKIAEDVEKKQIASRVAEKGESSEGVSNLGLGGGGLTQNQMAVFKAGVMMRNLTRGVRKVRANEEELARVQTSLFNELATTIKPLWLDRWLSKEEDTRQLAIFHALDNQLSPYLADHSVNSAFSLNPQSRVFQKLLEDFPQILDWLLGEEMEVVQMFGKSMQRFISYCVLCDDEAEHLSEMIDEMDLAPIAIWLCGVNTQRNSLRKALKLLLSHIRTTAEESGGGDVPWSPSALKAKAKHQLKGKKGGAVAPFVDEPSERRDSTGMVGRISLGAAKTFGKEVARLDERVTGLLGRESDTGAVMAELAKSLTSSESIKYDGLLPSVSFDMPGRSQEGQASGSASSGNASEVSKFGGAPAPGAGGAWMNITSRVNVAPSGTFDSSPAEAAAAAVGVAPELGAGLEEAVRRSTGSDGAVDKERLVAMVRAEFQGEIAAVKREQERLLHHKVHELQRQQEAQLAALWETVRRLGGEPPASTPPPPRAASPAPPSVHSMNGVAHDSGRVASGRGRPQPMWSENHGQGQAAPVEAAFGTVEEALVNGMNGNGGMNGEAAGPDIL